MAEPMGQRSDQPDARISVAVSTDRTHDLETAVRKLNPILQEIVQARNTVRGAGDESVQQASPIGFGRVHFSRSWSG